MPVWCPHCKDKSELSVVWRAGYPSPAYRELLCVTCGTYLGYFKDLVERLNKEVMGAP